MVCIRDSAGKAKHSPSIEARPTNGHLLSSFSLVLVLTAGAHYVGGIGDIVVNEIIDRNEKENYENNIK